MAMVGHESEGLKKFQVSWMMSPIVAAEYGLSALPFPLLSFPTSGHPPLQTGSEASEKPDLGWLVGRGMGVAARCSKPHRGLQRWGLQVVWRKEWRRDPITAQLFVRNYLS